MNFTKMHGIGNDFIVVNCMEETIEADMSKLSELTCNRHFGIGADGLMLVMPSLVADFKMHLYNSDGSFAEMCGNGVRCFAKYVYDHHLTNMPEISVETPAGIKKLQLTIKDDKAMFVTVDMGVPVLRSHDLDMELAGRTPGRSELLEPISVGDQAFQMVYLDTGVPHAVIFSDIKSVPFYIIGPELEKHPRFTRKANIDFTDITARDKITVRVWERGAGETMACGTGATAAAAAAYYMGLVDSDVDVKLPGGTLNIRIAEDGHMYMRGPATEVYTGQFEF